VSFNQLPVAPVLLERLQEPEFLFLRPSAVVFRNEFTLVTFQSCFGDWRDWRQWFTLNLRWLLAFFSGLLPN